MKLMNKTEKKNLYNKIIKETNYSISFILNEDIPKKMQFKFLPNEICFYLNILENLIVRVYKKNNENNFEVSIDGEAWALKKFTVDSWKEVLRIIEEMNNFNSELFISSFVSTKFALNEYHRFIDVSDELENLLIHFSQRTHDVIVNMILMKLEGNIATEKSVSGAFYLVIEQLNKMLKK